MKNYRTSERLHVNYVPRLSKSWLLPIRMTPQLNSLHSIWVWIQIKPVL